MCVCVAIFSLSNRGIIGKLRKDQMSFAKISGNVSTQQTQTALDWRKHVLCFYNGDVVGESADLRWVEVPLTFRIAMPAEISFGVQCDVSLKSLMGKCRGNYGEDSSSFQN